MVLMLVKNVDSGPGVVNAALGWWLVAGEVVDFGYPAFRELLIVAVEHPPTKSLEGMMTLLAETD